jgi:acyl-CoA synthetase (AMP-forming)/AMP-acid ligase II
MATPQIREVPPELRPFSRAGISRDEHGVPHYEGLPTSLLEMLQSHVSDRPDTEAVVELGGQRLTYRQLWDRAARVAGGLRAAGLQRGARVALRHPAGADWVLAFWGTLMAGGIPVAINTRSAAPEVGFVVEDSDARIELSPQIPLPDAEPYVTDDLAGADIAALFYTSGTTGQPKGVPTTHEAFLTNAENIVRGPDIPRDIGAELRTLICVPLFHVTGCNSQLIAATYLGGTSVIMPALDLPAMPTVLARERITLMVTVPAIYALLLGRSDLADADVSHVRWVGYGGAPIAPSLVDALRSTFANAAVFNGYGMTETSSLTTVLPDRDALAHADSVGYAVPSVDIAVEPLGDDPTTGELLVRGANVTAGYWNRPEATAETITDGWLHTGDVVRVDDAGRVHIIDRTKDIINRGGENISSVEVENALATAPGVAEAAVVAVPDAVMGEKVGAVLFGGGPQIVIADVIAHCRERLADFKVPQYVSVSDDPLPRNPAGKLLKATLRKQVRWGPPLR